MTGTSHTLTCIDDHPHDKPNTGDIKVAARELTTAQTTAGSRFSTGFLSLPEVRWALLATVLFVAGLLLRLAGVLAGSAASC